MSKKITFKSSVKKEKLSLLPDVKDSKNLTESTHIEMFSNKEITIEGCKGVAEYRDDYLKLRLNKGMLILCGKCFDISNFENEFITVQGSISSMEFCK